MTSSASSSAVLTEKGEKDLWLQILRKIEPTLQRSQFITWFKDTTVLGREDKTLVVGLPLPMFLNWHLEHYQKTTLDAARGIDESISKVVYKVDGGLKDNHERTPDLLAQFPELKKRQLQRASHHSKSPGLPFSLSLAVPAGRTRRVF